VEGGARIALAVGAALLVRCTSYGGGGSSSSDDAGPGLDGGAGDGALIEGGGGGSYCSRLAIAPALCADFDEGDPPEFGFGQKSGDVSVDTSMSSSAPGSLLCKPSAFVTRVFDRTYPGTWRLSFDIAIETALDPDAGGGFQAIATLSEDSSAACTIMFAASQSGWSVSSQFTDAEGGLYRSSPLTRFPTPGQFRHVELVVSSLKVSVTMDGTSALDPTLIQCSGMPGHVTLTLGGATATGSVHFDNVVFDGE
jgi:hypothetical protein